MRLKGSVTILLSGEKTSFRQALACFENNPFQKLFYVGVEALGATVPLLDTETVPLAFRFFEELGVPGVKKKVNSIGCPNCRPKYREALKAKFAPIIGQFCENCRRRFDRNVFRILDCEFDSLRSLTVEREVALTADAPRVQDSLCAGCLAHDKSIVSERIESNGRSSKR